MNISDEDLLEAYDMAVKAAMSIEHAETGFASNMSRRSIVAGLRAVAALESATTVTDERVQRLREACFAQGMNYPTITEATTILAAALTEGERR